MIRTQAEFAAAIAAGQTDHTLAPNADIFVLVGDPILRVTDGQPRVVAYDSSQPRVVASGSSQPRVEAYDSSQPRVVASGSSQPRVEAYDSSQPRVEASDSSQLSVTGAVHGTASAQVAVLVDGDAPQIIGGQQTRVTRATVEQWCAYYGVPIRDGVVTLYKAVGDDCHTQGAHRYAYVPGTTPVAPDWDGGVRECGGGLHFSPRPMLARKFAREATRFVACPVAVADIAVHQNGQCPEKVKARGCCAPVWECDEDGEAVRS